MAASRLKHRGKEIDEDVYEFGLNPVINRILLRVMRAEVHMTLAGVRWPAGGSRIVVARAV